MLAIITGPCIETAPALLLIHLDLLHLAVYM